MFLKRTLLPLLLCCGLTGCIFQTETEPSSGWDLEANNTSNNTAANNTTQGGNNTSANNTAANNTSTNNTSANNTSDLAVAVTVAKWEGELDEASYRAKPVE